MHLGGRAKGSQAPLSVRQNGGCRAHPLLPIDRGERRCPPGVGATDRHVDSRAATDSTCTSGRDASGASMRWGLRKRLRSPEVPTLAVVNSKREERLHHVLVLNTLRDRFLLK